MRCISLLNVSSVCSQIPRAEYELVSFNLLIRSPFLVAIIELNSIQVDGLPIYLLLCVHTLFGIWESEFIFSRDIVVNVML